MLFHRYLSPHHTRSLPRHLDVLPTTAALLPLLYPLLHLLPPLVNPPLISAIAPILELGRNNTLEHLAREAHKVVPPQRILKLPVAPLALFPRQQFGVAKLARPLPLVPHHGQQVEPDLSRVVARDAPLQHGHDLGGEVALRAGAVADGRGLQAVELVERAVDGGVGNEVEGVLRLRVRVPRGLVDKGRRLGEAVVHVADQLRVGERLAPVLWGQGHGEFAELAERRADVDVCVLVGIGVGGFVEKDA